MFVYYIVIVVVIVGGFTRPEGLTAMAAAVVFMRVVLNTFHPDKYGGRRKQEKAHGRHNYVSLGGTSKR